MARQCCGRARPGLPSWRSTCRVARKSSWRPSSKAARQSRRSSSTRLSRSSASASMRVAYPRLRSARKAHRTSSYRSRVYPTTRRSRASSPRRSSSSRPVIYTDAASTSTATGTPTPGATDSSTPHSRADAVRLRTTSTAVPTDASDPNWVSPALYEQYTNFDCASLATQGRQRRACRPAPHYL